MTTVLELLTTAREVVSTHGHMKKFYFGKSGKVVNLEDSDCVCTIGALHKAGHKFPDLLKDEEGLLFGNEVYYNAVDLLAQYTERPAEDARSVINYNDLETTTKEDILHLYDSAIRDLQNTGT